MMGVMNVRMGLLTALGVLAKIAFLGAAGFALYSALTPSDGASSLFPWDKLAHFAAFYVVTLLALPAFPRANLLVIAAGLLGLGVAIEFLQMLPGVNRDADWKDVVADGAGIAAALAPVTAWRLRGLGVRPARTAEVVDIALPARAQDTDAARSSSKAGPDADGVTALRELNFSG